MASGTRPTVCVEIPVKDDPHLPETVGSLVGQTVRPDRVLVVATPSTPQALLDAAAARADGLAFEALRVPGYVVEARQAAIPHVVESVTAFLDSDTTAPPNWLELLLAPLAEGAAFAGGPTRPSRPPENSVERYIALLEHGIYEELVPERVTYLPLQNTVWKTEVVRTLGFDIRIPGAEDHDLETRAAAAGYRGVYVREAWVGHDKSNVTDFFAWARRRYRAYLLPMAMSLLKNGELAARMGERRRRVRHPLAWVEACIKPVALLHARLRWARLGGFRAPPPPVPTGRAGN
jgi:GT2 family glycosyltransferase